MSNQTSTRMLDIIRQIGEAAPSPIRLSKIFQSPEQDFFSFSAPAGKEMVATLVFERLAQRSANIRFIGGHIGRNSDLHVQLCVDSEFGKETLEILQSDQVAGAVRDFRHHPCARILSFYPFNGQALIAERIFAMFALENIEILGVSTATSTFSCVIPGSRLESAVERSKQVFVLP
jgi:aspartokinase